MLGCGSFGCDGVGWPFAVLARGLGLAGFFFGRPISGIPSWGLVAVDGLTAFRLPGGGSLSVATERNQRAPRDFVPGPYQGVPPGPPKGWGKRPIPSYPCGAIGRSPAGGIPPPATPTGPPPSGGGLEQSLVSISPWPAGLVAKRLVPHRSGEHRIRPTERRPETPGRT